MPGYWEPRLEIEAANWYSSPLERPSSSEELWLRLISEEWKLLEMSEFFCCSCML